jgi:phosphonoacetate hydrolase
MTARPGKEVMMNDARFLRAPTILAEFQKAGAQGRDGHRQGQAATLLGKGLDFDERPRDRLLLGEGRQGRPWPRTASTTCSPSSAAGASVYSADLSEFVFAAGVKLLKELQA